MVFKGQVEDFGGTYERTYPAVYRTILAISGDPALAAELAQDTFVTAYRQRATFRGDVPFDAWVHRIAVNMTLSTLRRRRVRWAEPFDPARHDRPGRTADLGDAVDVQRALRRLEPRQRAAIVLRFYHDFDYATIASIMGVTTGTVGATLSRAMDRLRHDLEWVEPARAGTGRATGEADHGR